MTFPSPQLDGALSADGTSRAVVVNSRTGQEVEIPHDFLCPITQCVMVQPLLSKRGFHNFERAAILQWLGQSDLCPVTRQPLKPSELFPNQSLEMRIKFWRLENHIEAPAEEESQDQKYAVTFLDARTDRHKASMSSPLDTQQPISLTSAILASAGAAPRRPTASVPSRQEGERRRKFLSRILMAVARDIEDL